jgi:hypothetical protein
METVPLPVTRNRPNKIRAEGGELVILPTVNYFLNLLVLNAPAELAAEYSQDKKGAVLTVFSLPEKTVIHTEPSSEAG